MEKNVLGEDGRGEPQWIGKRLAMRLRDAPA
jgi:hypothetical protein